MAQGGGSARVRAEGRHCAQRDGVVGGEFPFERLLWLKETGEGETAGGGGRARAWGSAEKASVREPLKERLKRYLNLGPGC